MNRGVQELLQPSRVREKLRVLTMEPSFSHGRLPKAYQDRLELAAAGVLIPLTEIDGRMEVVFTQRPDTMKRHSGEVSFPGGRAEPEDRDLLATALRETREEIALLEKDVDSFGALVQMPTVTGFDVTTFVGEFSSPYPLRPDPREIDVLFQAPLTYLSRTEVHRVEQQTWQGIEFDVHYYDYEGFNIWGATGYMLHTLLSFLLEP